jgi:hypothetical protein
MEITYFFEKDIDKKQLQDLFLSVEWSSGNYSDQLKLAILNSHKEIGFYNRYGFEVGEGKSPMFVTYLTT